MIAPQITFNKKETEKVETEVVAAAPGKYKPIKRQQPKDRRRSEPPNLTQNRGGTVQDYQNSAYNQNYLNSNLGSNKESSFRRPIQTNASCDSINECVETNESPEIYKRAE